MSQHAYARFAPEAGERWTHYKGGQYRILALVRMEPEGDTGPLYVAYRKDTLDPNSVGWVRPLSEFMETVELKSSDGPLFVPRFTKES